MIIMTTNLLPQPLQKQIRREFYWRTGALVVTVIFLCLLAGMLLYAPTFLVAHNRMNIAESQLREFINTEEGDEYADLSNEMSRVNDMIALFEHDMNAYIMHDVVEHLARYESDGVHFSQLEVRIVDRDDSIYAFVDGQGQAQTRDGLLSFVDAMEGDALFDGVEVPVSSFVQERDITFPVSLRVRLGDDI